MTLGRAVSAQADLCSSSSTSYGCLLLNPAQRLSMLTHARSLGLFCYTNPWSVHVYVHTYVGSYLTLSTLLHDHGPCCHLLGPSVANVVPVTNVCPYHLLGPFVNNFVPVTCLLCHLLEPSITNFVPVTWLLCHWLGPSVTKFVPVTC